MNWEIETNKIKKIPVFHNLHNMSMKMLDSMCPLDRKNPRFKLCIKYTEQKDNNNFYPFSSQ